MNRRRTLALVVLSCVACSRPPPAPAPLPASAAAATSGQRALALELLGERLKAKSPQDNTFLSPFSISAALSMTSAGARGATRKSFDEVVHLVPGDDAHEAYAALHAHIVAPTHAGAELRIANRIYAEKTYSFAPAMLDVTRTRYSASLERVDFKSASEPTRLGINTWVAEQTNQRILDLLPPNSVDSETRMVLVNAIYFLGKWRERFDDNMTIDAPFHAAGGDVPAKLMHASQLSAELFEEPDAQWLRLRYQRDDVAMLIGLPRTKDGLQQLLSALDPKRVDAVRAGLHSSKVDVALPRFRIEDGASLSGALKARGMTNTFCGTDDVDLSGIGGPPGELCVSDVIHKAFVQVDEAGTEAAAATAVVGAKETAAAPQPKLSFVADHPFVFFIEHVPTGAPLFVGVLQKP